MCFNIASNVTKWILKDSNDEIVKVQTNTLWAFDKLRSDALEACFIANLKPLSLNEYKIEVLSINDLQQSNNIPSKGNLTCTSPNI